MASLLGSLVITRGYIPEAQVDKWALYRVAQYCDQLVPNGLGGFEPRFTCNLYLQTREQAYKVVQDMASIFRGMVYWSGGAITVTQDAPADPVYQFAPSNVVDGEFAYQGSAAKARHTVALVTWNDPEDFYRQKVEYVEDAAGIARYGIVQSEVVALGCTSRGQAHRVGKWLLYSEQSESEIVTFRTGLEGAVMRPGDVIKVADPVRGGMRLGGRIAAASASTVTLDQDLPADLPWRLSVILPTGAVEERLVGPISGRALTVTIPFSAVPQAGAIWVLSSTIIEPQLFRVVAVAERDPGVHEVTALAHNPSKFDAIEKGLALQPRSITVLSDMPPAPTGLSMQESLYRVKDQAQVLVQVSWNEVQTAVAYRLSYRVAGGNFVSLPLTSANYVEIRDAQEGAYEFSLRAIGITRKESVPATLSATVLGKTLPPSDVTGFLVQRRVSDLLISWDELQDADLSGYEVRVGTGWDNGQLVAKTAGTQMVHDQSAAGLYTFCALLVGPAISNAQALAGATGERAGITAVARHVFDDITMPGKEFRVLHTTYAPGGQNPKHYHPSHVVFYVLEGSGVWQEEGKEPVTLKPGDSLHVRPGMIHAHRNLSATEKLVFLEFVIVDKSQRSTVPMR